MIYIGGRKSDGTFGLFAHDGEWHRVFDVKEIIHSLCLQENRLFISLSSFVHRFDLEDKLSITMKSSSFLKLSNCRQMDVAVDVHLLHENGLIERWNQLLSAKYTSFSQMIPVKKCYFLGFDSIFVADPDSTVLKEHKIIPNTGVFINQRLIAISNGQFIILLDTKYFAVLETHLIPGHLLSFDVLTSTLCVLSQFSLQRVEVTSKPTSLVNLIGSMRNFSLPPSSSISLTPHRLPASSTIKHASINSVDDLLHSIKMVRFDSLDVSIQKTLSIHEMCLKLESADCVSLETLYQSFITSIHQQARLNDGSKKKKANDAARPVILVQSILRRLFAREFASDFSPPLISQLTIASEIVPEAIDVWWSDAIYDDLLKSHSLESDMVPGDLLVALLARRRWVTLIVKAN